MLCLHTRSSSNRGDSKENPKETSSFKDRITEKDEFCKEKSKSAFDKAASTYDTRNNGFLAVHDEIKNMSNKLKKIPTCDYKLIDYFSLPEDAWWKEYYSSLQIRIKELRKKYGNDPEAPKILEKVSK